MNAQLEKLAQQHGKWVEMARSICKNNFLADDLVSEMYIKLSGEDKDFNKTYIYKTLVSVYINHLKSEKKLAYNDLITDEYEYDEERPEYLNYELPDTLTWPEQQIMLLRQDKSCRDIAKQYHINYLKVHRIEKSAKEKLKEWAKTLKD